MKCLKCGKENDESNTFCYNCKKIILKCSNCNAVISENDNFCGMCGNNLEKDISNGKKIQEEKEEIEKEKSKRKLEKMKINNKYPNTFIENNKLIYNHQEKQKKSYAIDLLIDFEGNKFKAIKEFKQKYNTTNDEATRYINEAYYEINKNTIENNISINHTKEVKEQFFIDPNGIKKTIIVASNSRKKIISTVGRGVVGGALIGPVGLLAGMTGKNKETTTFQIIYNNGNQETVTVKTGGWMFKEYCKYLDK